MLVLNRKIGESIIIDDNIEVTIVDISDGRVKIGVQAPREIAIHRKEVYEIVTLENQTALKADDAVFEFVKNYKK